MVLEFLNTNAGAAQAISSALGVFITAVLAFITWQYVKLTRQLAEVARVQLEFQHQSIRARRFQLIGVLTKIHEALLALPIEPNKGESIRKITIWKDEDLADLQLLAADSGSNAEDVANSIMSLRWIKGQVDEVNDTPIPIGYNWKKFPWDQWLSNIQKTRQFLHDMRSRIESTS